jgi:HEAT repeat protein
MATVWGTLLVVGAGTLTGYLVYKRRQRAAHDDSLAATTRLLGARQKAVEQLKQDLSAKAVELRTGALSGLAETRDGSLVPSLVPLLRDSELKVQVKDGRDAGAARAARGDDASFADSE